MISVDSMSLIVDEYIADLGATFQLDVNLKIRRMKSLGIPQERIADGYGKWGKMDMKSKF